MRKSFPQAELAAATGATPVRWEVVRGSGYGTNTAKWCVELDDGRRVFVKLALDDLASRWLRDEWRVYVSLSADFMPELLAWHDSGGTTFLIIEDLTDAYWPPPWLPGHVSLVLETLEEVHAAKPPPAMPFLTDLREELDGWPVVAADPEPFLSTGVCSRDWLAAALPAVGASFGEVRARRRGIRALGSPRRQSLHPRREGPDHRLEPRVHRQSRGRRGRVGTQPLP